MSSKKPGRSPGKIWCRRLQKGSSAYYVTLFSGFLPPPLLVSVLWGRNWTVTQGKFTFPLKQSFVICERSLSRDNLAKTWIFRIHREGGEVSGARRIAWLPRKPWKTFIATAQFASLFLIVSRASCSYARLPQGPPTLWTLVSRSRRWWLKDTTTPWLPCSVTPPSAAWFTSASTATTATTLSSTG